MQPPPQSKDIEDLVLASMVVDKDVFTKYSADIEPDTFYSTDNKEIFTYMVETGCCDVAILIEKFHQHEQHLLSLVGYVGTWVGLDAYIDILKDKARRRGIIAACLDAADLAYKDEEKTEEILGSLQESIIVVSGKTTSRPSKMSEIIPVLSDRIEAARGGKCVGLPTGIGGLDNIIGGLFDGDLVFIAGRPSMGKSALAFNIVQNVAIKQNFPVLVFSVDMSKQVSAGRMWFSESGANLDSALRGYQSSEDREKINATKEYISQSPIFIDDTPGISIGQVMIRSEQYKKLHDIRMIVVDHIGLVKAHERGRSRHEELSSISKGLKETAKRLRIPVVPLCQLNRTVEYRNPPRPMLSDLRESGSLEEDAQVVIMLYRDEYYNRNSDKPNICEISVNKNQNGRTGYTEVYFDKPTLRFRDLETKERGDF